MYIPDLEKNTLVFFLFFCDDCINWELRHGRLFDLECVGFIVMVNPFTSDKLRLSFFDIFGWGTTHPSSKFKPNIKCMIIHI